MDTNGSLRFLSHLYCYIPCMIFSTLFFGAKKISTICFVSCKNCAFSRASCPGDFGIDAKGMKCVICFRGQDTVIYSTWDILRSKVYRGDGQKIDLFEFHPSELHLDFS